MRDLAATIAVALALIVAGVTGDLRLIAAGAALAILTYGINVGAALVGAAIMAAGGILATVVCPAEAAMGADAVGATTNAGEG